MIQQYYNTKNEFGSDILLETWLSITLIHLIQFLQKNQNKVNEGITVFPDLVKNAIQYVDDHYTENISVASISRYLNIRVPISITFLNITLGILCGTM